MLTIWNPLTTAVANNDNRISTRDYIDRLFNDTIETAFKDIFSNYSSSFGIEYVKTDTGISINIDVPGVKLEDINVDISDGMFYIKAERKTQSSSHKIAKSFSIPEGYDTSDVNADLSNGILTISLKSLPIPKKEVKKIEIKQK